MKKILTAILLAMLIVPVALAAGSTFQPGLYKATKNLNVRYLPRAGSFRINHLHKGDEINVKRLVNGWCEIKLPRYRQAWVACSFLEAVSGSNVVVAQTPEYPIFNGATVGKTEDGNWTLGSSGAKVVIEEFSDMECPYCGSYYLNTFPQIFHEFIATGKVKYVFHDFPLAFHPYAQSAANAARCAGDQNFFWQMHQKIMENQDQWAMNDRFNEVMSGYAAGLGLDPAVFEACVGGDKFKAQIDADYAAGLSRGVDGTPSFFVNGKVIMGSQPFEVFAAEIDAAIDAALAAK